MMTDCGNYTAVAENELGKAYSTCQVFIKDQYNASDFDGYKSDDVDVPLNRAKPPKVIHGLQNISVFEGEPVAMACKIDGFPKPKITWMRNGEALQASTRLTTQYDINTGVARLRINDAHLADAGIFTCIAENKAGHDRTTCTLEVKKVSNIDNTPMVNPNAFAYLRQPSQPQAAPERDLGLKKPRIVIPLKNIDTQEGKLITLACKIEGEPVPNVSIHLNPKKGHFLSLISV